MTAVRYFVVHETRYAYGQPVSLSRQMVRLRPRVLPYQSCETHALTVAPAPQILGVFDDAFGNGVTSLFIEEEHASLDVRAESRVTVSPRALPADAETPAWEDVRARLSYEVGKRPHPEDLEASRFLFESSRVRNKRELAAWAGACFGPRTPLLAGVRALNERLHAEITFDPDATTVSTPVMEVFAKKRGVCQDLSHLMLSCLRSLGIAARYVSGYVLTRPPPGKPRLVGADASHAWVSVYCPDLGWIDVDPTNASFPGAGGATEHVTLAWGRDFDDVTPLRGVLLGGGSHTVDIAVTVAPADDYEALMGRPPPVSGR